MLLRADWVCGGGGRRENDRCHLALPTDCRKKNKRKNRDVDCHVKCDPRRKSERSEEDTPFDPTITNDDLFQDDKRGSSGDDGNEDTPSSSYDDGHHNANGNSNSSSSSGVSNFSGPGRLSCSGFSTLDESACKIRKRCEFTSSCETGSSMKSGWSGSKSPYGSSGQCGHFWVEVLNKGVLSNTYPFTLHTYSPFLHYACLDGDCDPFALNPILRMPGWMFCTRGMRVHVFRCDQIVIDNSYCWGCCGCHLVDAE